MGDCQARFCERLGLKCTCLLDLVEEEKDGWTVSQIIDTKNGTVKAFWSFNDDKSTRGKRSSMFVDARFEYVK
jgi:hypothetical protein